MIPTLRKTFLDLIMLDGVYPNEDRVIQYVKTRLAAMSIPSDDDDFGNMIIRLGGSGEPLLFSTHLDIPEPAPAVKYVTDGSTIRSDGSSILGADPKSGLAILIELLDELRRSKRSHRPLEIVLTRGEEAGLLGARNLDYTALNATMGLVLDEDGPVTQVVTKAPGYVRVDAEFIGKTVHPREPEKGVNAFQAAVDATTRIPCGYSTDGVTWNIGLMSAGTARNSVPGKAVLSGELRSYDTSLAVAEAERIGAAYREVAAAYGAECRFSADVEFQGYTIECNHPLLTHLEKTFTEFGLEPNYFATYGGSDANIFNAHGIAAVPIGSGYHNAHEYTEYVDLAEMQVILEFLRRFISN